MACHGDYCLYPYNITATSATLVYSNMDAGDQSPYAYTVYNSDMSGVVTRGTTNHALPDLSGSYGIVTGLSPATEYIAQLDGKPSSAEHFTTLSVAPKVATEEQWHNLARRMEIMGGYNDDDEECDTGGRIGGNYSVGRPIYRKTISFGVAANSSTSYALNISGRISNVLKMEGIATVYTSGAGNRYFPIGQLIPNTESVGIVMNDTTVTITNNTSDRVSGRATVYYTKIS